MQRLTEASSFAGFAALTQAAKFFLPAPYHGLCDGLTALLGSLAVVKREGAQ